MKTDKFAKISGASDRGKSTGTLMVEIPLRAMTRNFGFAVNITERSSVASLIFSGAYGGWACGVPRVLLGKFVRSGLGHAGLCDTLHRCYTQ
jgi:hypothetical protein